MKSPPAQLKLELLPTSFVLDDGGRAAAGYKGTAGDCVCRAIAIVTGQPYQQVYDALNELGSRERLIVSVSKHLTAVIDGMIYDTHDPSRGGSRCVYGYYSRGGDCGGTHESRTR
jgi:hypothetical protein